MFLTPLGALSVTQAYMLMQASIRSLQPLLKINHLSLPHGRLAEPEGR